MHNSNAFTRSVTKSSLGSTGPQGPIGSIGPSGPESVNVNMVSLDMGFGMGGRMKQQVFKDPYGIKTWSDEHKSRVFIHMCNSLGWRYLTGSEPPTVPLTATDYTAKGFKWFHYYEDGAKSQQGTKELKKVKSVAEFSEKKKMPLIPENQPAHIPMSQVQMIKQAGIRDGSWEK